MRTDEWRLTEGPHDVDVSLMLRVPAEVADRLVALAVQRGESVDEVGTRLLAAMLTALDNTTPIAPRQSAA